MRIDKERRKAKMSDAEKMKSDEAKEGTEERKREYRVIARESEVWQGRKQLSPGTRGRGSRTAKKGKVRKEGEEGRKEEDKERKKEKERRKKRKEEPKKGGNGRPAKFLGAHHRPKTCVNEGIGESWPRLPLLLPRLPTRKLFSQHTFATSQEWMMVSVSKAVLPAVQSTEGSVAHCEVGKAGISRVQCEEAGTK